MSNCTDRISIEAPRPGACPLCAMTHDPSGPHDRNSLYYQMRFYRQHRRFPTWNDAMAHCSGPVQMKTWQELIDNGVIPEDYGSDESAMLDRI